MSDWGWITLGYSTVYGTMLAYAVILDRRLRNARRRAEGLR